MPDRTTGVVAPSAEAAARAEQLAELIARTALSDQTAFADLYRQTAPKLYGVALRIVRERATAEEILQDAYVSVWRHAHSYSHAKSQPLTWLASIVRNRCLDHLRRREVDTVPLASGEDDPPLDVASEGASPLEMLLAGADAKAMRACVDALEGGQKQAIALAFYQGLSHQELAAHLAQPLGTVKSWVRRGLERLKQCLDRAGITS